MDENIKGEDVVSESVENITQGSEPVVAPVKNTYWTFGMAEVDEIEGYIHALPVRLHNTFRSILAEVKQKL